MKKYSKRLDPELVKKKQSPDPNPQSIAGYTFTSSKGFLVFRNRITQEQEQAWQGHEGGN